MLLLTALLATGPVQAAGSWVADARLPDIQRRGRLYTSPELAAPDQMPTAGRRITRVHWRYGYRIAGRPGPQAQLCAPTHCIATDAASGVTQAFAQWPADTVFRLHVEVPGHGSFAPALRAGHVQLVVDFD